MSLSERLEQARKPEGSVWDRWIAALPTEDRKALEAAAVDPALSNQKILAAVIAEGAKVSKDTISAWRRDHGFTR